MEHTLIPYGLHVVGQAPSPAQRVDLLMAIADSANAASRQPLPVSRAAVQALVEGKGIEASIAIAELDSNEATLALFRDLARSNQRLSENRELEAILHGLDGGFLRPAPGGDLIRTPDVLPTGRNLHGFDPFRIPSAFAVSEGARQAAQLIERHMAPGNPYPESIALVLWGTDNLKTEGGPIGQALALWGARPRFDAYGRIAGATLVPLTELGRPASM